VVCHKNIQLTGHVPAGDVVVIGNVIPRERVITFESNVSSGAAGTLHSHIQFGIDSNARHRFTVYAVVMPQSEKNYLVGEAVTYWKAKPGQPYPPTSWHAFGLPPAPAYIEDRETVQRTSATTGC
jgi:hypothetical protein